MNSVQGKGPGLSWAPGHLRALGKKTIGLYVVVRVARSGEAAGTCTHHPDWHMHSSSRLARASVTNATTKGQAPPYWAQQTAGPPVVFLPGELLGYGPTA
jgi:hypothetical protein